MTPLHKHGLNIVYRESFSILGALFFYVLQSVAMSQPSPNTLIYDNIFDGPRGILHGTWDFDEWPGVDHPATYKNHFLYQSSDGENIKIDYSKTDFDADDHEGYLKTPYQLETYGIQKVQTLFESMTPKVLVGIFAHPDDDILLAGGLLSYASSLGWEVHVILVSNGADGTSGYSNELKGNTSGYNAFGVMEDGSVRAVVDSMAILKTDILRKYSKILGVDATVLDVDITLDGNRIVQLGEYPDLNWEKSFGEGSQARLAMTESITRFILGQQPSIVITHGTNGEYGNYLHKTVYQVVRDVTDEHLSSSYFITAFPEYNYNDTISHYLDLDRYARRFRNIKFQAFKALTFIHNGNLDYDKLWSPSHSTSDGVFVKDYGYSPIEGYPPRYEYYQVTPSAQDRIE